MKEISTEVKQIEEALKSEEEAREKAIKSLMNNVPIYQKTLIELSSRRAKYPDEQLSSSFVKAFDLKINELMNALPTSFENTKNKAMEIDSEIKNVIACLTNMLEAELNSRYERIYGRPEYKLALKFKSAHK